MGEAGRLGELLSQIVLLGAYDACVQDHFPERIKYLVRAAQQPITLASFLEKLLPSSHMELLHEQGMFTHVGENKEISEDYCVFFNHFSLLTEPLSSDILAQGLRSASAFQNAEGTPGSDLTIPLYGSKSHDLLGALHVQVKTINNEAPALRTESIVQKLEWGTVCAHDESALIDLESLHFFGIHLSLRGKRGDGNRACDCPLLVTSSQPAAEKKHPDIYIRLEKEGGNPRMSMDDLLQHLQLDKKERLATLESVTSRLNSLQDEDLKKLLKKLGSNSKAKKHGHLVRAVLKQIQSTPPRYPASNIVLLMCETPLLSTDEVTTIKHLLDSHSTVAHRGYTVMSSENRQKSLEQIRRFQGESTQEASAKSIPEALLPC